MNEAWLAHHGIKGQKWGVRRFQNPDGTYTSAGKKRYSEYKNSVKRLSKKLTETDKKIDELWEKKYYEIEKNPKQRKSIEKKYIPLMLKEAKDFIDTFMREKNTDKIYFKDLDSLVKNGDAFYNATYRIIDMYLDNDGEYKFDYDDDGVPYFRKTKGD